jgi:cellulose synthase/poly-beta-1,6-N-acetylglucosamine synthase-like glycosyltransferase
MQLPFVTIVIPVRNEERILGQCLESIAALDYPRDRLEVIVADSLSTDRSRAIAEQYGAKIVANPGRTVVSGRNRGLEAARGEFVAFTDADCVVSRHWLRAAVEAFAPGVAGVGGVTLFPKEASAFQKAVNVLFLMAGFAGATAHRQNAGGTCEVNDIPGCNAIYRRSALLQVMPLDEDLLTGEDVWLNWMLRQRGFRHLLAENMILWHHRRSRPASFVRQMYRFAIGRLQVGRRCLRLLSPLHILAGAGIPLLAAGLVLALVHGFLGLAVGLLLLAGAGACALGTVQTGSLEAGCCVPPVIGLFLASWSCGFLRELFFPVKLRAATARERTKS